MTLPPSHRRDDCPSCGFRRTTMVPGYHRAHLARCAGCTFVFAARKPTGDELSQHYAHKSDYSEDAWVSELTRKRLCEIAEDFEPYRRNGRILDVGCGQGLLLDAAAEAGWTCYGTEYSEVALAHGRARGFHMLDGGSPLFEGISFDVVVLTEVIEHMPEPRDEMTKILEALRPGGLLYLTTPNFRSLSRRILRSKWNVIEYPAHLGYFSPRSLIHLMERLGCSPISVRTTGISPTRFGKSLTGREHLKITAADADEKVRRALESRRSARWLKAAANAMLSATGSGDAIKAHFRKAENS